MRALFGINIHTNSPVHGHKGLGRNYVDWFRGAVIQAARDSGEFNDREMALINFKPSDWREAPTILYGQPVAGVRRLTLYGRGDEGAGIIERLGDILVERRVLQVGDRTVFATRRDGLSIEPFLPSPLSGGEERHYYMATPAIFYDKRRDHGEWLAVSKKYQESAPAEYERQMRRSISNLVRSNILYQVKHVVFPDGGWDIALRKLEDFSIEIDRFHFKIDRYHRDENMTPMLFMHFRSRFTMPRFIGHHSGRGYGLVALDRRWAENTLDKKKKSEETLSSSLLGEAGGRVSVERLSS